MLSFLRGLPMLNTLIIEEALPTLLRDDTSPDNPSPRQLLRNLHALTLCGSVDACSILLQQICYATATAVTLKCNISSSSIPNFSKLLRAAKSAAAFRDGDDSIQSLYIACRLECLILSHPLPSSRNVPRLAIIMGGQGYILRGDVEANHLLRSSVIGLPIAEVQTLYLSEVSGGMDWSEFLRHLPKVHTIYVRYVFPAELISLLALGVDTMGSSRPVTVMLPRLRSLWLTDINFRASGCTSESFLACLQSRAQLGSAIQDLHIKGCVWLYEPEMKECVQDVHWDGIEHSDRDWDDSEWDNDYEDSDWSLLQPFYSMT